MPLNDIHCVQESTTVDVLGHSLGDGKNTIMFLSGKGNFTLM